TAERVEQAVYFVSKKKKTALLIHLLTTVEFDSVLVFSRTKHGADKIVKKLLKADIEASAIHGNKSQNARQRALSDFKIGKIKVLVATDIAARGIDVSELSLVINYDLPNIPETYVHRIGRTGRASASGTALSFCDLEEISYLRDIQKLIGQDIHVVKDQPFPDDTTVEEVKSREKAKKANNYSRSKKSRKGGKNYSGSNNKNRNSYSRKRQR
ncbi:MAG: helicase-related protein, partial [Bacteroidota bacterium]|nr:helicase-related protein [Bacteroidota bacterium]